MIIHKFSSPETHLVTSRWYNITLWFFCTALFSEGVVFSVFTKKWGGCLFFSPKTPVFYPPPPKQLTRAPLVYHKRIWLRGSDKTSLLWFFGTYSAKLARPCCHNFQNKWSRASVWRHCNVIQIKWWNLIDLVYPEAHLLTRLRQNINLGVFGIYPGKTGKTLLPQFLKINGHGDSMWCQCDVIHIKEWNLINLVHQKRIWLRGSN